MGQAAFSGSLSGSGFIAYPREGPYSSDLLEVLTFQSLARDRQDCS
jgi:hypothetical protein